jgi:hypothetical protein
VSFEKLLRDGSGEADDDNSSWERGRRDLRPLLRPCSFALGCGDHLLSLPATPFLIRAIGIDHPDRMTYVGPGEAKRWRKSPEEVYTAALEAFHPDRPFQQERTSPPLRTIT